MIKSNILYPSVKNELRISLFTWCLSYVRSGEPPSIPVGSAQQCPTGNFHWQYKRHIIDWQANSQYYFIACRSLLHFCLLPMRAKRPRDDGFSGFPSQKWGSNDANRDVERYVVGTWLYILLYRLLNSSTFNRHFIIRGRSSSTAPCLK